VCEVKAAGADHVFDPLRAMQGGRFKLRKGRPGRFDFE